MGETRGVCSGPSPAAPAAYNLRKSRWQLLAAAPGGGRVGHVAVWTGDQMLIWGGTSGRNGSCEPTDFLADGAAFELGTNEWSGIPEAPIQWLEGSDAVWTGREMLVWNGGALAAYDPSSRTWRAAPPPPLEGIELAGGAPRVARVDEAVAWSGEELIIWGGRSDRDSKPEGYGDGAAYDPLTDVWTKLPPARAVQWPQNAVWHEGSVYINSLQRWLKFHPAEDSEGRQDGAPGSELRSGWTELTLPITQVIYPEEVFAAASFRPPADTEPKSQCSPDTVRDAMPADAALVRVIEYTRVRDLKEFPPRPRRFRYSDGLFGRYECAGDSFLFRFRDECRAFQAHVNLDRSTVDRTTKAQALEVLSGLNVRELGRPTTGE